MKPHCCCRVCRNTLLHTTALCPAVCFMDVLIHELFFLVQYSSYRFMNNKHNERHNLCQWWNLFSLHIFSQLNRLEQDTNVQNMITNHIKNYENEHVLYRENTTDVWQKKSNDTSTFDLPEGCLPVPDRLLDSKSELQFKNQNKSTQPRILQGLGRASHCCAALNKMLT